MIVLDRLEGETAVLETDDGLVRVPRCDLPEGVRCGDVLILKNGRYIPTPQVTKSRLQKLAARFRRLRKE